MKQVKNALNNSVKSVEITSEGGEKYDILQFFANVKEDVRKEIERQKQQMRNIKWYMNTKVKFKRDIDNGTKQEETNPHFRSKTYVALENDDEEHELNEAFQKMNQSLEEFIHRGSNCILDCVISMEIHTVHYSPISGSSFMELPRKIRFSGGVANVKNTDNQCFKWAVLSALYPAARNPHEVYYYRPYENQ